MKFLVSLFFSAAFAGAASASMDMDDPSLDVAGVWLTKNGGSKVEVFDCGDGTPCGRIAWINPERIEAPHTPETLFDMRNPDEMLRGQPLLGSMLIQGFSRRGDKWKRGEVYDWRSGKSYRAHLALLDDGRLEITGCLGPFCRSQAWQPATLDEVSVETAATPSATTPTQAAR